jgi:photosystem II stability/assembly factor-like uncharacterized protein
VKRVIVVFLACLFIAVGAAAWVAPVGALVSTPDGDWFWRSPQPAGYLLNAICWRGDALFAVGEEGIIVSSADSGVTWSTRPSPATTVLNDVTFAGASDGWAVGGDWWAYGSRSGVSLPGAGGLSFASGGLAFGRSSAARSAARPTRANLPRVILHTADGGLTWRRQAAPSGQLLEAVEFADPKRGWAVGDSGAILHTADGGGSWLPQASGTRAYLQCVAFSDALHGWIGGATGALLHTVNGGRSWRRLPISGWPKGVVWALSFSDATHGWVLLAQNGYWNGGQRLMRTHDAGRHWQTTYVAPRDAELLTISADNAHVCALGSVYVNEVPVSSLVVDSVDGGTTWRQTYTDAIASATDLAVAAGQVCASGFGLAYSPDGRAWLPRTSWSSSPDRFTMIDANHGWGLSSPQPSDGDYSTDLLRTENGANWRMSTTFEAQRLMDLDFVDASRGWVVGSTEPYGTDGRMYATRDGGTTWQRQAPDLKGWFTSVDFLDSEHGWVCGMGEADPGGGGPPGLMLTTADGGTTWTRQQIPAGFLPLDVQFLTVNEGWASGYFEADDRNGGAVAHTNDGGAHWTLHMTGADFALWTVDFIDAYHGWALSWAVEGAQSASELVATSDGGVTWRPQGRGLSFENQVARDVLFTDQTNGWLFADHTWRTRDGGATWKEAMEPADVSDAFAVGSDVFASGWGFFSTADRSGDTAPPVTSSDFDGRWHRSAVAIELQATDVGGGRVVSSEYRVDEEATWHPAVGPVLFAAPADGSNDGVHELWVRSVDESGNVESARWQDVPIDATPPTTEAPRRAAVTRGGVVQLAYLVRDSVSPSAHATITIRPRGHTNVVARLTVPDARVNGVQARRYRCQLPPGRYVFTVTATDLAGNVQSSSGSNTLIVRPKRP